jgi:hypothetical protein
VHMVAIFRQYSREAQVDVDYCVSSVDILAREEEFSARSNKWSKVSLQNRYHIPNAPCCHVRSW